MNIDTNKLNDLEKSIYDMLLHTIEERNREEAENPDQAKGKITIVEAAELCRCSPSKISKFVRKVGFKGFKQFIECMCSQFPERDEKAGMNELVRIRHYVDGFDRKSVDQFLDKLKVHDRIILLGYGPSQYCASYMEYKLRLLCGKQILAVPDTTSAHNLLTKDTLLVIFSTTGHFASFEEVIQKVKSMGGDALLIVEEYNLDLLKRYEQAIFLTTEKQSSRLLAHQKSRVMTFIFIEEVLFQYMRDIGMLPEEEKAGHL